MAKYTYYNQNSAQFSDFSQTAGNCIIKPAHLTKVNQNEQPVTGDSMVRVPRRAEKKSLLTLIGANGQR